MPKARTDEIAIAVEGPGFSSRQIEWGDMTLAVDEATGPLDGTEMFAGLPGGRCQCPHWGYVIEGSITFRYEDRDEVVQAGEVYYAAPGHIPVTHGGGRLVELSPTVQLQQTMAAVNGALAEAGA